MLMLKVGTSKRSKRKIKRRPSGPKGNKMEILLYLGGAVWALWLFMYLIEVLAEKLAKLKGVIKAMRFW